MAGMCWCPQAVLLLRPRGTNWTALGPAAVRSCWKLCFLRRFSRYLTMARWRGIQHSIDPCDRSWQWHCLCYNCPKGCGLGELDSPYLHKLCSTPQKTAATGEGMHPFPCHFFLHGHLPLLSPEYRGVFQIEGNLRHISQACNICLNRCELASYSQATEAMNTTPWDAGLWVNTICIPCGKNAV